MSLQRKLLILVIGITIIPFISVMLVFAFQSGFGYWEGSSSTQAVAHHLIQQQWLRNHVRPALEAGDVNSIPWQNRPRFLDVVILDDAYQVVFSNVEGVRPGEVYQATQDRLAEREQQLLSYEMPYSDGIGYIVSYARRNDWQSASRWEGWFGLIVPLSLLLFASLMSFTILRGLRRSIMQLEEAASRIAEGDLDFELEVKGRDEIASLTRSFEAMRRKVKEEYARRARFIMGVSHDLKTPLALIEGYADAIAEGYADSPEKLQHYSGIIKGKSKQLEGRILQLIEFVKMESGQWQATHEPTELGPFLEEICRRWREDAPVVGASFAGQVEIPSEILVPMDQGLVTRALENLIHNALRYSGSNKAAQLQARIEQDGIAGPKVAVIEIINRGPGIDSQDMEHIFEPFYRGSQSRKEEGMGLGLASVKNILESHGWTVRVHSVPNERTRFRVEVPLSAASKAG